MTLPAFTSEDFDAMTIPGLEGRMDAIIRLVRPKLAAVGERIAPHLSAICGEPMYPHVARHARRKVNPPNDTWVAWAPSKKGYKSYPHFQVGLWSTHLFIQFAIIYESPNRGVFAGALADRLERVKSLVPDGFFWSTDHMQPQTTPHRDMTDDTFADLIRKLTQTKSGEALCGLSLDRHDPVVRDGEALQRTIEQTFETLVPLYRLSFPDA